MKINQILFLIFIFSSTLHSQEPAPQLKVEKRKLNIIPSEDLNIVVHPRISITINHKTINCDLDSISKIYLCQESGKTILVKYNSFGFVGISKDSNNSITTPFISHVQAAGKILFDAPETGLNEDIPQVGANKYKTIDRFFTTYENGVFNRIVKSSDKSQPIYDSFFEEKNKIEKDFHVSKYIVELENGQKINCSRESKRVTPSNLKEAEKKLWDKRKCGSFKCDAVKRDGKLYDVTLLYDSDPEGWGGNSIHLMDQSGLGPSVLIKKISSSTSKNVVVDNSKILENIKSYKGAPALINSPSNIDQFSTDSIASPPTSIFSSNINQEEAKVSIYKNLGFQQILDTEEEFCSDDNKSLSSLKEARSKLYAKIAELELAEFIQVLADGSLVSDFIDPSQALKVGCLYEGVYLNKKAAENLNILKKNIHPDSQVGKTISMSRATELFNKATKMGDIAWNYIQDGCYARAHLMARRFEAEGVRVDKVWIKGSLYVPDSNPKINWKFHVAPIVYVDDGKGGHQKMVIDPSLFSKPVTVEEWDKKMSKNTLRGSVITSFPYPENAAIAERAAIAFSSSDSYFPGKSIHMTEQQKMNDANQVMRTNKDLEINR